MLLISDISSASDETLIGSTESVSSAVVWEEDRRDDAMLLRGGPADFGLAGRGCACVLQHQFSAKNAAFGCQL